MKFTGSCSVILTQTLSLTQNLALNLTLTLSLDVYNMGPCKLYISQQLCLSNTEWT